MGGCKCLSCVFHFIYLKKICYIFHESHCVVFDEEHFGRRLCPKISKHFLKCENKPYQIKFYTAHYIKCTHSLVSSSYYDSHEKIYFPSIYFQQQMIAHEKHSFYFHLSYCSFFIMLSEERNLSRNGKWPKLTTCLTDLHFYHVWSLDYKM